MFFKLSTGVVLNLRHIRVIPCIPGPNWSVTQEEDDTVPIMITMNDGTEYEVSKKDALQMRDIVLFEPYDYRKSC